ncbi:MAG: ABC transporter permease [Dethiosulfovibrio sp.]|nr:ABC transporter permease [Dethiosulfovibrio sp.]
MSKKDFLGRLLQMVLVLLGVSFIAFSLMHLSPGDPAEAMLKSGGQVASPELLAATRAELGLDRPFLAQYGAWLFDVFRGDLGISYSSKQPVATRMMDFFPATLKLTLASLVMMLCVAVPAGVVAAVYHDRWPDYLIRSLTFLGVSVPNFWVGLMLLSFFALKLMMVSVVSTGQGLRDLFLPALTLAFAMSAKYTRQVRTAVLEELNQDYVLGAEVRGESRLVILCREVLPNAVLPLITLLGLSLGSLLGGTAVVEIIFSWPGLGNLAVQAISARDYPMVQGYVLWISLVYMVINFAVDVSYNYLDPRLRGVSR